MPCTCWYDPNSNDKFCEINITHWMPLPNPPEES